MCCLFTSLVLVGPRVVLVIWWLTTMERFESAFSTFFWPFLGFLFFPYTTLAYVAVAPQGRVVGSDWFWLGAAVVVDLVSHTGGAYKNRERMPSSAT